MYVREFPKSKLLPLSVKRIFFGKNLGFRHLAERSENCLLLISTFMFLSQAHCSFSDGQRDSCYFMYKGFPVFVRNCDPLSPDSQIVSGGFVMF